MNITIIFKKLFTSERPLGILLAGLLLCSPLTLQAGEKLRVFVSVLPQKTFVTKVGGEWVEVHNLVQPGQSPEIFSPTPQQMTALAEADLYVRTRVPFEQAWMPRIQAINPEIAVLDATQGMELLPLTEHGDGHDHAGGLDPHVWTSPLMVQHSVRLIRDKLIELDPSHRQVYQANADAFLRDLEQLDTDIRSQLSGLRSTHFMVFHPAWGYFAQTYGLTQIAIEHEGKEPGAKSLAKLINQARQDGIRIVFTQPQSDQRLAEQLARAIGGRVVKIDPLNPDYLDNMRQVARQFREANGG